MCLEDTACKFSLRMVYFRMITWESINPLNAELNPICHLLALLGAHHILHFSRIRVNADVSNTGHIYMGVDFTKHQRCKLPTCDNVTGRKQYRCILPKAVHTLKNCSWGWVSLSPETCRADLERSINGICCMMLVTCIAVLMLNILKNVKFSMHLTTHTSNFYNMEYWVSFD